MEEIKRTLLFIKRLLANIHSLYGSSPSMKCIVDKYGRFELTTNGLNYLKAIHCSHWVYDIIYEDCMCFAERYGFGTSLYLIFLDTWCTCYRNLIHLDIPTNTVSFLLLEILERSSNAISEKYVIKFQNIENSASILMRKTKDNLELSKSIVGVAPSRNSNKSLRNSSKIINTHNSIFNSSANVKRTTTTTTTTFLTSRPSRTLNFSRYSRHAMIDTKEADEKAQKENLNNNIRFLCSALCKCSDIAITSTITDLYLIESTCLQLKGDILKSPSQLNISSDRIIVNSYVGSISNFLSNCLETSVFKGIALECNEWFLFDILEQFHNKNVNIVLINTNVYGDNLPDSENLEIKEVITGYENLLDTQVKSNHIQMLKELNVSVVLHRGNLDIINVSEYSQNNIVIISVKDFTLMYKLSLMLSCRIIFGIQNIKKEDVCEVNLCLYRQTEQRRREGIKIKYAEKASPALYFIIRPVEKNGNDIKNHTGQSGMNLIDKRQMYYSVILVERTKELGNIKVEMFWEAFNRVQFSLKDELLILSNWSAEEKLLKCISEISKERHDLIKSTYSSVQWIKEDCELYLSVVSEQIITCIESLIKCYSTCDKKEVDGYESFKHRRDLWHDSLQCVRKCTESRLFDMKF